MFGSSKIGGEKVLGVFSEFSSLEGEKCSEDVSQDSLYTLLKFRNMQHFEDEISGVLGEKFWLMLVDYFSAGIQEPTRGKIVLKVVNKIISNQDKGIVSMVASGNEPLSKKEEIEKVIRVLEKISPQEAFRRLKAVKKGVEDTLNECQGDVLINKDYSKQILRYLQDLEKCSKNTTGPIIERFLSYHIDSFGKLTDELLTKMKDAVLILRDDGLRCFYNREVEREHIPPMVSYAQCKKQYDTANRKIMQSHVIVAGQKPAEVNVEKAVEVQTITNKISKESGKIILYDCPIGLSHKNLFEKEMVRPFRKQIWREVVSCLVAGVKEPTRFYTVAHAVNQIIEIKKKSSTPTFLLSRKEFSKEEFEKATKRLESINPQKAFKELKMIKLQARSILDKHSEGGVPNQDAFEQNLQYLEDLERWLKAVKKPVIDKFLSNSSSFLRKFRCESRSEVSEVMSIVWDDELKYFLEVEKKLNLNNLSVSVSASAGNKLANVESDVNGKQATCSQPVKEDSGVNSKSCSEDDEGFYDAKQYEGKGHDLSGEVTLIDKKESQLEERLTRELNDVKEKLVQEQRKASELSDQVIKLTREVDKARAQLKNDEIELKQAKQDASALEDKVAQSDRQKSQLQGKLDNIRQRLDEKIGELVQINEENIKLRGELKLEKHKSNDLKTKLQESKSKIREQEGRVENLQRQLQSKNEELKGKNKKLSAISARSRKQITYASVSFVLSGAFSIGASLTMFNLAICISLAVAALVYLVVGCYCSYRASTALGSVEVDQVENCINHTASGTQIA